MISRNLIIVCVCLLANPVISRASESYPNTKELEVDLREIRAKIEISEREADKYTGGFILAQIQHRTAVLKSTESMLDQKIKSLIHGINLVYTIDGRPAPFVTADQLGDLKADMKALEAQIKEQQTDADRYSGGLVMAMKLATVATSEMALAMLNMKYLWGSKRAGLVILQHSRFQVVGHS